MILYSRLIPRSFKNNRFLNDVRNLVVSLNIVKSFQIVIFQKKLLLIQCQKRILQTLMIILFYRRGGSFLQLMYQSEGQLSQYDTLHLKNQPKFQCLLQNKEQLILSTNIFKYNSEGKCQQRILVVTNIAILNILKSENIIKTFMKKFINFHNKYQIKRRILLVNLYGITITPNRNSNVFLIHVNNEHDYHYRALNNKMLLIKVIAEEYKKLTKNPLQFFFKEECQINNFFTTKSHLRQKKDIKPKDPPSFLDDQYFLDKYQNEEYVCEYSHKNENVQPKNFKRVDVKNLKQGQSYFILIQQFNHSIHVESLNKEQILLNPYYTFYSQKKQLLYIPFMMGGNMKKFLSKFIPINEANVIFYLKQVLIFLLQFHEKGNIYCNITLENMLIKQNGYLMLNGLQKSIQMFTKDKLLYKIYGNPFYFPPQVVECRGYGPQIDVWKLGVCAYFLYKGEYPFKGTSTKQLYYNILHRSVQNDKVPAFIKSMLQKDRQRRIKVGQLLDLEQFNNQNLDQIKRQMIKAPFIPDSSNWQTSTLKIYQLDTKSNSGLQ